MCDISKREIRKGKKDPTKAELIQLAKERGVKNSFRQSKEELAKNLNIILTTNVSRKKRVIKVLNSDGTITTYPSIKKASEGLGVCPSQIYVFAVQKVLEICG